MVEVSVRHRVEDGQNTSWALITMDSGASANNVLAAGIRAGPNTLRVERVDVGLAGASTGMMREIRSRHRSISHAFRATPRVHVPQRLVGLCHTGPGAFAIERRKRRIIFALMHRAGVRSAAMHASGQPVAHRMGPLAFAGPATRLRWHAVQRQNRDGLRGTAAHPQVVKYILCNHPVPCALCPVPCALYYYRRALR